MLWLNARLEPIGPITTGNVYRTQCRLPRRGIGIINGIIHTRPHPISVATKAIGTAC